MITFVLLVCFVLIAIAFFLIILLFQRVSSMKDIEKKQSAIIKEMEEIITGYLLEMKEENEIFLKKLAKTDDNTVFPIAKTTRSESEERKPYTKKNKIEEKNDRVAINIVEEQISKLDLNNLLPSYEKVEKNTSDIAKVQKKEMSSTGSIPKDDLYVQSLSAQAMLLQKKGDTIDQIAKKLGKGKTEIELLLKFRQN